MGLLVLGIIDLAFFFVFAALFVFDRAVRADAVPESGGGPCDDPDTWVQFGATRWGVFDYNGGEIVCADWTGDSGNAGEGGPGGDADGDSDGY